MAKPIKAPEWAPDANIDPRGWRDPVTGELLVARKFTADQIAEFNEDPAVELEVEDNDGEDKPLKDLNKSELTALAAAKGLLPEGKSTKKELLAILEEAE